MKKWQLLGFLAIIIFGFLLISGCTSNGSTSSATVTVTPTPTLSHSPTPLLKTVLFSDDLSHWRSEWTAESDDTKGKTFYSGGSLHIRDTKPPTGAKYHRLNKHFNNFILDVDTTLIDGAIDNFQGVVVRMNDEENYYGLFISADGYYSILKWKNGKSDLAGLTRSSYINTGIGATNHIHIEVNKNTLSLSVNGNHITTVTDNTFNEGDVALVANCLTSNSFTEVGYNNLIITTI